jgi:predicted nucleic acid-binding protein
VPDLAALLLAQLEEAILLTGDGALRSLAEGNGIEVHGMLWVLEEMIQEGVLVSARAVRALETMLENGSRLPEAECRACLRRWTEA